MHKRECFIFLTGVCNCDQGNQPRIDEADKVVPLQIESRDVVELNRTVRDLREIVAARAKREAELNAEVLRLRAALKNHKHTDACRNYAAEKRHAHCITECRDSYEYALAADPGPLVAAVEQVATVLGERHAKTCQSILLDCDCKLGRRQRAAIAAYRAAMGGKND